MWYYAEIYILDGERQVRCETARFTSAEACKEDLLSHYRHCSVGRPRIFSIDDGNYIEFVEEVDMRTKEQIEYSKESVV